jgi:hypothetical protein
MALIGIHWKSHGQRGTGSHADGLESRRKKPDGAFDKKKRPSERKALKILVRLAGFEPTTPWFVAKYSIQLSYSRIVKARL